MKKTLSQYDYLDDGHIYEQHKVYTDIEIDTCTVVGSTPQSAITSRKNEDAYAVLQAEHMIICGVFDGVSSQKPIEGLVEMTGARHASHVLRGALENIPESILTTISTSETKHILNYLNDSLREQSSHIPGFVYGDIHAMPASTATVALIDIQEKRMHLEHIGDSWCILFFSDQTSSLITVDLNKKFDEQTFTLIKEIATEKGITNREAVKDERVKHKIRQKFSEYHNRPDGTGTGVLNGHEYALGYVQSIDVSIEGVDRILLGTDGLIPPNIDTSTAEGRNQMYQYICTGKLAQLILEKKDAEDKDLEWHYLRTKHSDDATGILITLSNG